MSDQDDAIRAAAEHAADHHGGCVPEPRLKLIHVGRTAITRYIASRPPAPAPTGAALPEYPECAPGPWEPSNVFPSIILDRKHNTVFEVTPLFQDYGERMTVRDFILARVNARLPAPAAAPCEVCEARKQRDRGRTNWYCACGHSTPVCAECRGTIKPVAPDMSAEDAATLEWVDNGLLDSRSWPEGQSPNAADYAGACSFLRRLLTDAHARLADARVTPGLSDDDRVSAMNSMMGRMAGELAEAREDNAALRSDLGESDLRVRLAYANGKLREAEALVEFHKGMAALRAQAGATGTGLVYLASPYSHPETIVMQQRFEAVCAIAAHLMESGELIFSPIAHTHPIAVAGGLPRGFEFWEKYDRAVISACSKLIVVQMDGWETSKGVTAEIAIANEMGIPVEYMGPVMMCPRPAASAGDEKRDQEEVVGVLWAGGKFCVPCWLRTETLEAIRDMSDRLARRDTGSCMKCGRDVADVFDAMLRG